MPYQWTPLPSGIYIPSWYAIRASAVPVALGGSVDCEDISIVLTLEVYLYSMHTKLCVFKCIHNGGVSITNKRASIVIDSETKEVFDWSMSKEGTRNFSEHVRKLLNRFHDTEDFSQLLKEARKSNLFCEKHKKPFTLICKDCEVALCPDCNTNLHQTHQVQFFCNIHEVGYQTTCMLCERDRWEGIVDVPMLNANDLKVKMGLGNIIFIDVRGDSEWKEGYLPNSHHIKWIDIRLKNTDGHKILENLIKEHRDKQWIFISQGSPRHPGKPARAWLAAADIKTMYHINEVSCLEGGWSNFHLKFPDIIEYPNDSSHILKSRRS